MINPKVSAVTVCYNVVNDIAGDQTHGERVFCQSANTLLLQEEMAERMDQCYLAGGPVEYMAAIFRKMADSDAQAMQLALRFYGPMFLLYSVYDESEDRKSVIEALDTHIRTFIEQLEAEKRRRK